MTPDRQPRELDVERVEWVPSSPDVLEVRVFGVWRGTMVPPPAVLVVADARVHARGDAPAAGRAPAWSAAFHAPVDARAALEAGEAALVLDDVRYPLPPAGPGALVEHAERLGGTVVDPAVLAERRARRAELAEQSAAQRAASAEQSVETLRAQLDQLEQRAARAGEERDQLAARVADAERQLRLAEQREEAERRLRVELEDEVAGTGRSAEAELAELRDRLATAEEVVAVLERELAAARRRQEDAEAAAATERDARRALEAQLQAVSAHLAQVESGASAEDVAELDALREETAALRTRLADVEAERAALDAELVTLREQSADPRDTDAELASLRRRIDEVEEGRQALLGELAAVRARAADDPARAEIASLRHHAEELEKELAGERIARAAAERRAAEVGAVPGRGERERSLAAQVESLETELRRRVTAQQHVQEALGAIRDELDRVRARVDAGRTGGEDVRRELEALDAQRRALEDAARAREQQLAEAHAAAEAARAAAAAARVEADELRALQQEADRAAVEARRVAADLQRRLDDERTLREAERPDLEARLAEVTAEVEAMRDRLRTATAELKARLVEERRGREDAEARLAAAAAAPGPAAAPSEGVSSSPGPLEAPPADDALGTLLSGLRAQVAAAREHLDALEGDPPPPEAVEEPPPAVRREPSIDDETRRQLETIEAQLRAAVPQPGSTTGAGDVIASLQHAADRLRAAAQEELARTGDDAPGPARDRETGDPAPSLRGAVSAAAGGTGGATAPAPQERPAVAAPDLIPRALAAGRREAPWLRNALVRLAERDPRTASELFIALLPAQAEVLDGFAYEVATPETGLLRVTLAAGGARVERPAQPAARGALDTAVEGDLAALAPLAAGGAGWRLRDADVRCGRLRLHRLLRARRAPVTLEGAAAGKAPLGPALLLTALAASVDGAWTAGHRFAVDYAIAGDSVLTVAAGDGRPLAVARRDAEGGDKLAPASAVLSLSADAVTPVLAGAALPDGATVDLDGDRRAVDTLHSWFDSSRGLTER